MKRLGLSRPRRASRSVVFFRYIQEPYAGHFSALIREGGSWVEYDDCASGGVVLGENPPARAGAKTLMCLLQRAESGMY